MIDRPGRRALPVAFSAVACASVLLGSSAASARIRITADAASTLPLGTTERIADPALTGRGEVQWLSPNERLIIGVLGGFTNQPHRLNEEPTLTATLFGVQGGWIFGPKDWGTRPYAVLNTGYAQMQLKNGDAQFDPPSLETNSGGFFVFPELGLTVQLTQNFGLKFNARYHYYRSFKQMSIDKYKTYDSQSFGLGLGLQVTF